ncbi:TadE-like protein [Pirellulimonas nuda]|uniref:TadE-like protein n=1 Tax=Pirellulimonas nuda TaxID=2528009 RepID=A0A518D9K9_9BACT|nr:TadE family protein [Pirellulimonas nuda]QDU88164.1 TadE-like protein [Pirellulimonas nuda]
MHRNPGKKDRRGATVVEFALVAPVFFLVILAMFEFSWLNVVRHTADNAAYEAARKAIVPGADASEATDEATRILRAIGARGARIAVDPPTITPETREVRVTIDIPMRDNAIAFPKFTGALVMHAESTLRTERVSTR